MAVKHTRKYDGNEKYFDIFRLFLNWVVSLYIILILAVMPFYFTNGYGRIGTNKYEFFHGVTVAMGTVFLLLLGVYLLVWIGLKVISCKGRKSLQILEILRDVKSSMSVTDWFALGYGLALILSYLHTAYRGETPYGDAWSGSNGWYMGFSTQMMFLGVYFAVSRYWKPQKWILFTGVAASFVVFCLGYCNRFGVYPIKMEHAQASFISTIGNINWFCGYAVTVFFSVLYYWWADTEKKWVKWTLMVYGIVGFGVLMVQGSNSGLLTLIVLAAAFYLLSAGQGKRMQQFCLMIILLGAACCVTMLLRLVFPASFQLKDTLTDLVTYTVIPAIILAAGIFMYILVHGWEHKGKYPEKVFRGLGKIGLAVGIVLVVLMIVGIVVNTLTPGSLGKLSELSIFTFDTKWGNGRGATYMAGMQTWLSQDLIGKLTGVGPDCMAMYIHGGSNQELLAMVQSIWGKSKMLTNAHCEWLTVMVNVGLLGAIGFAGMIVSAIVRYIRAGKSNVISAACGIGLLAYTVNNIVSFQQAMATTTMFVILGIGETYMRRQKK